MLRNPRYVIAVHDLERSARYYRDVLGFEIRDVGDPGWRFFVKDQCFIMAGECRDALAPHDLGDHSYFAYVEVDDADAWFTSLVSKGVTVIKPLRTEPWRMREFGIRTIDGHRIMFGCPVGSGARRQRGTACPPQNRLTGDILSVRRRGSELCQLARLTPRSR
jgi:predicted enzyme related to lactoylglutathione lyase